MLITREETKALGALAGVGGAGARAAGSRRGQCHYPQSLLCFILHLLPAYTTFLLAACILNFQRALALFVLTCVVLVFLAHSLLKRLLGPKLLRCVKPLGHPCLKLWFKR